MSIQSKPATQDYRDGHDRVFGTEEHINAACCTCLKCHIARTLDKVNPLRVDITFPESTIFRGMDRAKGIDKTSTFLIVCGKIVGRIMNLAK